MANVTFTFLDQAFNISTADQTAFASSTLEGTTAYSYDTTGLDDWEFSGSGLTYAGGLPTGGTITAIDVDLDNDGGAINQELEITGLSVAATAFGIGVGTAAEQNSTFWRAALGGADTISFTSVGDFSVELRFGGDGADLTANTGLHIGANDSFIGGPSALRNGFSAWLYGDFIAVNSGVVAIGGNDVMTIGAYVLSGDFGPISSGASAIGGDDTLAPVSLADRGASTTFIFGDSVGSTSGTLAGGDDLIDLRNTNVEGYTGIIRIRGDAEGASAGNLSGGDDTIYGSSRGDDIRGEANTISTTQTIGGDDQLWGFGGQDTILGQTGNDYIEGGAGADSLDGGTGIDTAAYTLSTAAVEVRLFSGVGIGGDANGDTLVGVENVIGSDFADILTGDNATDNVLRGGAGNDTMSGLAGNDTLYGDVGFDVLNGDGGIDTVDYSVNPFGGVVIRLFNGSAYNNIAENDALSGLENVVGTNFGDELAGANGIANRLDGLGGNDSLNGLGGNDTIFGGAGNDTVVGDGGADELTGGAGSDTIDGGGGVDTAYYDDAAAGVIVRLFNGTGSNDVAQGDSLINVENLVGSDFGDELSGANGAANVLRGGEGNDTLDGLGDNDTLYGGAGNDTLTGDVGNDTFVFERFGASNADRILDFQAGAGVTDVINLQGFGTAFNTFGEVIAASVNDGFGNVIIDFGSGNTLRLDGVTVAQLVADDFTFG